MLLAACGCIVAVHMGVLGLPALEASCLLAVHQVNQCGSAWLARQQCTGVHDSHIFALLVQGIWSGLLQQPGASLMVLDND